MKKVLIGLLLATSLPLAAFAGGMPPGGPNGGGPGGSDGPDGYRKNHIHKMEMIAQELGLNEDQKNKVLTIMEEQKAKFQAVHDETRTRLQGVLTPEQLTKFESMRPPHHMMPPPPPAQQPQGQPPQAPQQH